MAQPKAPTRAQAQVAARMAATLRRDGVIRLPRLLSEDSCRTLREHVLQIQKDVYNLSQQQSSSPSSTTTPFFDPLDYYGVEPGRNCRTDLLLPFDTQVQSDFSELLASTSPLRHLFCECFPLSAPLYEVAAVITSPGSHRQTVHPDLPHKPDCPLYVVFCALQDVTADMGPTSFLLGTQEEPLPVGDDNLDPVLQKADVVISTMKAGDVVVFDARILHCGNANSSDQTRALFNFSFRQPDSGPLGYQGSIRKAYENKITVGELLEVADGLWGDRTFEGEYGNGLVK